MLTMVLYPDASYFYHNRIYLRAFEDCFNHFNNNSSSLYFIFISFFFVMYPFNAPFCLKISNFKLNIQFG